MPIKRAAYKQLRADKKKRLRNARIISEIKTFVRSLNSAVSKGAEDRARILLKQISSKLYRAVSKNVIHRNTASRKLSRLSKKIDRAFKEQKK